VGPFNTDTARAASIRNSPHEAVRRTRGLLRELPSNRLALARLLVENPPQPARLEESGQASAREARLQQGALRGTQCRGEVAALSLWTNVYFKYE